MWDLPVTMALIRREHVDRSGLRVKRWLDLVALPSMFPGHLNSSLPRGQWRLPSIQQKSFEREWKFSSRTSRNKSLSLTPKGGNTEPWIYNSRCGGRIKYPRGHRDLTSETRTKVFSFCDRGKILFWTFCLIFFKFPVIYQGGAGLKYACDTGSVLIHGGKHETAESIKSALLEEDDPCGG